MSQNKTNLNPYLLWTKEEPRQVCSYHVMVIALSYFLFLYTTLDRCIMPLGMEDRRILTGHLRASSSYNYNHGPDRARLNIYASHGRTGAWVAKYRNTKQWLQIDLRQMSIIKGIATQGRREAHQWVTSYTMSYSVKGLRFRMYTAFGRMKVRIKTVGFFMNGIFVMHQNWPKPPKAT